MLYELDIFFLKDLFVKHGRSTGNYFVDVFKGGHVYNFSLNFNYNPVMAVVALHLKIFFYIIV